MLGQIQLSSHTVTPNGDGRNDQISIAFDIFGVAGGDVSVEVYDLAGHRIATPFTTVASAGPYAPSWDATGTDGRTVLPGIYLVKVKVAVDEGDFATVKKIAVAY